MKYKTFTETVVEVPLQQGRLLGQQKIRRCMDAYGPVPTVLDRRVVFAGTRRTLKVFSDLATVVPNMGQEIPAHPNAWARLFAFMHDWGLVVGADSRLDLLSAYGVDIRALAPKVKPRELRFHAMKFGLDLEEHQLSEIRIDLSTLTSAVKTLTTLEELKAGGKLRITA